MLSSSLRRGLTLCHKRSRRLLHDPYLQTVRSLCQLKGKTTQEIPENEASNISEARSIAETAHDLTNRSASDGLTKDEILKIANVELVSKKEAAIMAREKKIMTAYAVTGLAVSIFGMTLGATVFLS